jgi:hypothetical protein
MWTSKSLARTGCLAAKMPKQVDWQSCISSFLFPQFL